MVVLWEQTAIKSNFKKFLIYSFRDSKLLLGCFIVQILVIVKPLYPFAFQFEIKKEKIKFDDIICNLTSNPKNLTSNPKFKKQ